MSVKLKQRNQSPHPFVGECIYCRSVEDLQDEHSVAYALNGLLKLRKASCRACADITSGFEGSFTHDTLEVARAVMKYKTRNKKERRESYPTEVVIKGEVRTVDMPVDAYAALVPMLDLGFATYLVDKYSLRGPQYRIGRRHTISLTVSRSIEKTRAFLESIGAQTLRTKTTFNALEFARMIAKTAYCEAIAALITNGYGGLECIKENFVLDFILRSEGDPWRYIGGHPPGGCPENRDANPDKRRVSFKDGDILAHIQLFVPIGGPQYDVVVARATEALRHRLHSEGYEDA